MAWVEWMDFHQQGENHLQEAWVHRLLEDFRRREGYHLQEALAEVQGMLHQQPLQMLKLMQRLRLKLMQMPLMHQVLHQMEGPG